MNFQGTGTAEISSHKKLKLIYFWLGINKINESVTKQKPSPALALVIRQCTRNVQFSLRQVTRSSSHFRCKYYAIVLKTN